MQNTVHSANISYKTGMMQKLAVYIKVEVQNPELGCSNEDTPALGLPALHHFLRN